MRQPQSQFEQHEGKARAELWRGSGMWPHQLRPCELEPPFELFDSSTLNLWDCEMNNWDTSYHVSTFGRITPGPRIRRPGQTIELDEAPWADEYYNLVPIVIEQFKEDQPTIPLAEQLLRTLPVMTRPVSFEVVGFGPNEGLGLPEGKTTVKFIADRDDAKTLHGQLQSHYPSSAVLLGDDLTEEDMWVANEMEICGVCGTAALECSYTCPILSVTRLDTDPLSVAITAMDNIPADDWAMLQILFQPANKPWGENLERAVSDPYNQGKYICADLSRQDIEAKFSTPLFAVSIRILAADETMVRQLHGWLSQFNMPPQRFLFRQDIPPEYVPHAIGARCTYMPGLLLNTAELSSLVHLPAGDVVSDRLQRIRVRTRAAPVAKVDAGSVMLGENVHRGRRQAVRISGETRTRHCYIAGTSGSGKSNLLLHMLYQDIQAGHGVGVIDPHGDLIDGVLSYIPESRINDVVYFNPADTEYPPAFNILQCKDVPERERIVVETVATIRRFYGDSWGPKMDHYFKHALVTLLKFKHVTLQDVNRIMTDDNFRRRCLSKVTDETLLSFWNKEFAKGGSKQTVDAVNNKLTPFLLFPSVRNILCQRESKLDFDAIINERKILLVRLPSGHLGEDMVSIFGTFIMSKIVSAAFRRGPDQRTPFYLYLDEFQNFVNLAVSFERVLSEARKYKLVLAGLANQYVEQLPTKLKAAVFGNVAVLICFRLGTNNAKLVSNEFDGFSAEEITSLDIGQAITRIGSSGHAFNLSTPLAPKIESEFTPHIIAQSRRRYGTAMKPERKKKRVIRPAQPTKKPAETKDETAAVVSMKPVSDVEAVVKTAPESATSVKPTTAEASECPSPIVSPATPVAAAHVEEAELQDALRSIPPENEVGNIDPDDDFV